MKNKNITNQRLLLPAAAALLICCQGAGAAETFAFDWSGTSSGNGATGHGTITFPDGYNLDTTAPPNFDPTNPNYSPPRTVLPDGTTITYTVAGAISGNGDFTVTAFTDFVFIIAVNNTGGADFTHDLLDQTYNPGYVDFNLLAKPGIPAPNAAGYQTTITDNDLGDTMKLTSLIEVTGSGGGGGTPAPEPATLALLGAGVAAMRFGKRRATA